MLVVWLVITFWTTDIGETVKQVEIVERVSLVNEDDYLFMDQDAYNHLIGDECPCSTCVENREYDEEDWQEGDEEDEESDDLD